MCHVYDAVKLLCMHVCDAEEEFDLFARGVRQNEYAWRASRRMLRR